MSFVTQRVSWSATGRMWVLVHSSRTGCVEEDRLSVLELESVGQSLSDHDRARWERYRRPEKKTQFLLSRLAVSHVLSNEYGSKHRLIWGSRSDGCPVLVDPAGQRVASVSLSHSRNIYVVGLDSPENRLGVDCEVIEHVSPNAVFQFLDDGMPDEIRNADEATQRWQAATRWTEFEAEWKAVQSGNTLEKTASGPENLPETGNRQSIGGQSRGIPLHTRGWRLISEQHPAHQSVNQCTTSLVIRGPDACICVASDSCASGAFLSDLTETMVAGSLLPV